MHLVDECGNDKRKGLVRRSDLSAWCNNSAQVLTLTKQIFFKESYESNDLTFLSRLKATLCHAVQHACRPPPPTASVMFHTQHLIHSVPKVLTKHSAHPECVHYHSTPCSSRAMTDLRSLTARRSVLFPSFFFPCRFSCQCLCTELLLRSGGLCGTVTINPDCLKQIAISRQRLGAIIVEMKHC